MNDTILGAASIFDSVHKDKNIDNIKEVLVDMKNEQAYTQRQLADLSKSFVSINSHLDSLTKEKIKPAKINIAISNH